MTTAQHHIKSLLVALFSAGELATDVDGNVLYLGQIVGPEGEQSGPSGVGGPYDADGISLDVTEFGGRRIREIEQLRAELTANGEQKFAKRIPEFHILAPPGTRNLIDAAGAFKKLVEYSDNWTIEAASNASKNVSHATFSGMGHGNAFPAWDYGGQQRVHLADHAAYGLPIDTAGEVVEVWKRRLKEWQNPSPIDFSPN